jgi:hypothetical protein
MRTSFVLELHREWSEFADECIGLKSTVEPRVTYPERRPLGRSGEKPVLTRPSPPA